MIIKRKKETTMNYVEQMQRVRKARVKRTLEWLGFTNVTPYSKGHHRGSPPDIGYTESLKGIEDDIGRIMNLINQQTGEPVTLTVAYSNEVANTIYTATSEATGSVGQSLNASDAVWNLAVILAEAYPHRQAIDMIES